MTADAPHPRGSRLTRRGRLPWRACVPALVVVAVTVALAGVATAEPDREDVRDAEEALHELEVRHQRAVEEYLQAEERLEELTGAIAEAEQQVADLTERAGGARVEATRVVRALFTGGGAGGLTSVLDAAEAQEAGRRATYLSIAERGHRHALEGYRIAQTELDQQLGQLDVARAEADDLRDELAERAGQIDGEAEAQRDEIAELRQVVAEREERERREREERERREREERERREREERERREREAQEQRAQEQREQEQREQEQREQEQREQEQQREEEEEQEEEEQQVASRSEEEQASRTGGGGEDSGGSDSSDQAPAVSSGASGAVEAAMSRIGMPYQWGASGPDRFDCSGLTSWAWRQAGVEIPRTSRAQYDGLPRVSRSELRPGDLVFFGNPIHHVAMYIGDGQMVEAPYSGQSVRTRSMDRSDYVGAVRPGA